jgi:hypothetical protein
MAPRAALGWGGALGLAHKDQAAVGKAVDDDAKRRENRCGGELTMEGIFRPAGGCSNGNALFTGALRQGGRYMSRSGDRRAASCGHGRAANRSGARQSGVGTEWLVRAVTWKGGPVRATKLSGRPLSAQSMRHVAAAANGVSKRAIGVHGLARE